MVETIIVDNSLTDDEKTEAIKILNIDYDRNKVRNNEGTRRICENCNQECLATLYCEFCFRNYLKLKFSNWTSGNDNIDNLIQKCQMETYVPYKIIEWIPYDNLKDIKYLTKGGFSEIYTAIWIDGEYEEWNSKEKRLTRCGSMDVVLKSLENVESANQSWFEEAISHLTISNMYEEIVRCNGLTQNPSNGNYMLVIDRMNTDLRKYLQQNHNQLTWKERIKITYEITNALCSIHEENAIHRDLHSGNILYSEINDSWYISDLGFCGPADKPTKSIYGNLPYIAPEVIAGREYTLASDIYSVAMLMWEISSGQPPFINYENDYYLATNIINGIRPRIVSEIPLEYKSLMEQCWNANLSERLDTQTLFDKMSEIHLLCQNRPDELIQSKTKKYSGINEINSNYTGSRLFKSKVHQFENFPEPKNATEEEQEAFHSKSYCFSIPYNIDDFNNRVLEDNSKSNLSKEFNELQINDIQNNYNREEILSQRMMGHHINIDDDEDEIYNNPNFHSEEQDEFNIPDDL
ncbi:kinase-like domain-containing protein [Rhizophagus irregularis DAOM 181602=DAOM 197198]|uniref:Kinase-like domain-containing protein n=2 Tax=Rhizophagus irregularis TaxID=588596 RepID=A0A2P4QCP0_RHIID|nr:kinase-like domain-containing protein [Rhizophagus irregularis DAOM 181602=DAOM 197198]POG75403.1 kinase-like domain-containing protein [Rhizophagus irregularis DAOM 181602=DAOM 197198]|eukprot:XP_025182269.1 kinase-like domain-containing protein [Rhizophagus irregularis DAOM 181602=DAOM 197198]